MVCEPLWAKDARAAGRARRVVEGVGGGGGRLGSPGDVYFGGGGPAPGLRAGSRGGVPAGSPRGAGPGGGGVGGRGAGRVPGRGGHGEPPPASPAARGS